MQLLTVDKLGIMFLVISIVSSWVKSHSGHTGLYWLSAIVGVTDIYPFVLSIVQGGITDQNRNVTAIAILIAASSNNTLKAIYALVFAGWRDKLRLLPVFWRCRSAFVSDPLSINGDLISHRYDACNAPHQALSYLFHVVCCDISLQRHFAILHQATNAAQFQISGSL